MKCLNTYDGRQRRQFLASKAASLGWHGVRLVCNATGVCRDTLSRGLRELNADDNSSFPKKRIRNVGGGRTPILKKHPEYLNLFDKIASKYTAGLPQDDSVIWLTLNVRQIIDIFNEHGINISRYTVCLMKKVRRFKDRSFIKTLTLKNVKDRNAQFEKIHKIRSECEANDIPIFSINASSHHIVKQSFMKLASAIGVNILMMHYPPYCSKYNPIEHCMFGPISRSWSGAPLLSIENARERAEATVTKKGLSIIATINQRSYETKRPVEKSYESEKSKRIVFDDQLPKWNYLIRCS